MSGPKYFYDIHCHAMNFSHPNLFAFLKRKWTIALLASPLAPVAEVLFKKKVKRISNLFSLMENDIADFFLIAEYFLKPMLPFDIGNNTYRKIILTPLMMDFGCKGISSDSFYNLAPRKPIAEQAVDVFNGIKKYCENELITVNEDVKYVPAKKEDKIFEIYPFLGINPQNYEPEEVTSLLKKYFGDYTPDRRSLFDNMGKFDGNIDVVSLSNFFAGIKVYPPLGFDPWPEDDADELAKVKLLYQYCADKKIPLTTHCSEGGFTLAERAQDYTSPRKWEKVLSNFKELKLNFAHWGRQDKIWFIIPKHQWEDKILSLISTYPNVYTDFSYRGCDEGYYKDLKKLMDRRTDKDKEKLKQRILFGSDFMINLLDIESYNEYLRRFIDTGNPLLPEDMNLFCSDNPERFLFG